jgi:hypothetical protein
MGGVAEERKKRRNRIMQYAGDIQSVVREQRMVLAVG